MVLFLLDLARQKKARIALLEVRVSNAAAYHLYTKLSFDEVGTRKSYYPSRQGREDAIILARDLTVGNH
jgi:ribosomal-protein-alanine N-acetyltransferase